MGIPSSFTARRSAASNLPNFELPPPPLTTLHNKYQPFAAINTGQPQSAAGGLASFGNLLTPPNTLPSESMSPVSPGILNDSSSAHGMPSFSPTGYWAHQPQAPQQYSYQSSSAPQWIPPRGLFSPSSFNSFARGDNKSPSTTDGLPPPNYELSHLPSFSSSIHLSTASNLPTMPVAQQQAMHTAYVNGQHALMGSATQPSPSHSQEAFHMRHSSTPTYYNHSQPPSASSLQTSFPYNSDSSPAQGSPQNTHSQPRPRISPHNSNGEMTSMQSQTSQSPHQYQRPYGQFPLPAMNGPIMSNLHSPSGQMTLVNGMQGNMMPSYNSGHAASMQQMYGMQQYQPQQQHPPPTDRPFKCDQCVQSFNRNHDLKRHQRIHLAVKPYPCGHCDKSFSRKDALKVSHTINTLWNVMLTYGRGTY